MKKAFHSSVLFSGGGTRFALYAGMYAALQEFQKKPSVLIASCGGAFTALIINAFTDDKTRKQYLMSEELYHFFRNMQFTQFKKLSKIGTLLLKKQFSKANAPFVEDVFSCYLLEMEQNLNPLLPSLANVFFQSEYPTIIIGSKMLFLPEECHHKRGDRKLYQKVLFTDNITAKLIDTEQIIIRSENYKNSTVASQISVKTDISMLDAVRISISDMFYMSPVCLQNTYFAGGAIDLVPVELADFLSQEIIAERKQKYNKTEEALVRAVLGFSGNDRLKEIEKVNVKYWVDTQNATSQLNGFYAKKYIDWKKMQVNINFPNTYQVFKNQVDKQWRYGYEQTIKALKK